MKTSEALTCQELVELVTDYLEGALPPGERARFEEHVSTCSGCAEYFAQMRETIRLTGTLSEKSLAPEAQRELLDLFRKWRRE